MKTPKFWMSRNYIAYALWPLSFIYESIVIIFELFQKLEKVTKPVICIGNITLGGSGKTPVALAIGKILQELDVNFAYLSRGYFGKRNQFGYVDKERAMSFDVGDEPLLLAERAPTFIAKNRLQGAKEIAKDKKIQVIVCDDGIQNESLKKDLSILVIDAKIKFGNSFLFPAGPLREQIVGGLERADFVIVVEEPDSELREILANKKVVVAKIRPNNLNNFVGKKLIAFCGLAYPEKFFSYLKNNDLNVIRSEDFMDHHIYKISELEKLIFEAKKHEAKLITTKKDWVRFPSNFKKKIEYLDIDLEFENKEFIKEQLKKLLAK